MDCDQMQALRDLAEFARDHAEDVYGADKPAENEGAEENLRAILEAADIAEAYLDA